MALNKACAPLSRSDKSRTNLIIILIEVFLKKIEGRPAAGR